MTQKNSSIYNDKNNVWPKFKINILLMNHYRNLYKVQKQCLVLYHGVTKRVMADRYGDWDWYSVSLGTQWDFYSHQQPIKLQQLIMVNGQYCPAEKDMKWVGRHNNGWYTKAPRITVTVVVGDMRTKLGAQQTVWTHLLAVNCEWTTVCLVASTTTTVNVQTMQCS